LTFSNLTSKSYALALYELSKESSNLDEVKNNLDSLDNLLKENLDFKKMILDPTIPKEEKKNALFKIADIGNFSQNLKKFLGLVSIKNRLFFLHKIIKSFLNLVSDAKGELKATLVSSKELTLDQQKKIQNELSKDLNRNINIDYKYNPDLLAGLTIQIGSTMIDTSIKSKLKKLEKDMLGT
tara:strand:- start:4474 stop:5019 length:546 start_codon:yes stop_codon:yes gene_type:complete